ncbi:hypothetical protein TNIN_243881 [Trichonephila inaurata madagascariensis]|uniref:Uncharacterized protein n=1 Tax=Trichonephila inaurata madagascariensis TaxID=2747483 RepID=A0A8X6X4I7_9ARAC|nr:hypothetical protein TNIN_243881 [Trichonephila inaurata madagascariensis]
MYDKIMKTRWMKGEMEMGGGGKKRKILDVMKRGFWREGGVGDVRRRSLRLPYPSPSRIYLCLPTLTEQRNIDGMEAKERIDWDDNIWRFISRD